jgi:hypothetical protein
MSKSFAVQIARWLGPIERRARIAEARTAIAMIEAKYDSGARPRSIHRVTVELRRQLAILESGDSPSTHLGRMGEHANGRRPAPPGASA